MEYYVYRNGNSYVAARFILENYAADMLSLLKAGDPDSVWFMEDAGGNPVET